MKTDVVIIGGSLAGATCAHELQRAGVDVVAFERDVFPRPKVCGGFLSPNAVECLDQIGLLDEVIAAGAVSVDDTRLHAGGREFEIPFQRRALGISRRALDELVAHRAPVEQGTAVHAVRANADGFVVETDKGLVHAPILIDAAGKLSRFTRRVPAAEFGVQYDEPGNRGASLDFWFFEDGYGGGVSVEGGKSNFCFLINKDAIGRYTAKAGRLITGPLAYDRIPGDVIAIGDAAGMVDPFCGEGMFHALDSGLTAARTVSNGLKSKRTYAEMRNDYELEWRRRWSGKRLFAQAMRRALKSPGLFALGLQLNPGWFLNRLWDRIQP